MFAQSKSVKGALDRLELTMQCETFISDFEENNPKSVSKYFPSIETQGCLFHYGKSMGGRVHKNGMLPY